MVGVTASAAMGVLNPVIRKLSTLLEKEYGKLRGVRRKIESLRDELSFMNTVLRTVSESEEVNPHVLEWVSQLRELSYDVEDCIQNFMRNIGHDDSGHKFIDKITSRLSSLKARHHIGGCVNELMQRAVEINKRRERYELTNPCTSCSKTVLEIDPRLPALFEEADRLVGIDHQMDKLVKRLTGHGIGSNLNLQRMTVAIVGFGGLGKTTLANHVFQKMKSQFHCTAFVSVSRRPDMINILREILLQVLESRFDMASYDEKIHIQRIREDLKMKTLEISNLLRTIKEYLRNNRYFVIIDDIWSKEAWDIIKCAFPENKNGSRIMATTRNKDISKYCCFQHEDYVYEMEPLGSDDAKRLFRKRIFGREDDCPLELNEITGDILKKCDGLPLAIVNIASLLATKPATKREWDRVRNSLSSALEQDRELEVVRRILFLSYYDLPHYLKICLLYVSICTEDYEIDRELLIHRWIAEEFIVEQRGQSMYETGEEYFNELINRNMIQPVDIDYNGRPRGCRVHDIMLDLLISLSDKENFVTVIDHNKLTPPVNKIRRLCFQDKCERHSLSSGTNILSHVRSITVFNDVKEMPDLLDLQVLRLLDVQNCHSLKDGDIINIGCLIHMRFLRITSRNISKIPREIGKLQGLQILELEGTRIGELPATLVQLCRLVRLSLPRGVKFPIGIGNMEALEELYGFDALRNSPDVMVELGNLTNLKVLKIEWDSIDETTDVETYRKSLIMCLHKLGEHSIRSLHIVTYGSSCSLDFMADSWCPPRQLQTFRVDFDWYNCNFSRVPRWISSLSELSYLDISVKQLELVDLLVLSYLPALLYLELYIDESPQEGPKSLTISSNGFQCLKELYFVCLNHRQIQKFEAGAMPKLEQLYLWLPPYGVDIGLYHLTSLKRLRVVILCRGARVWEVEAAEAIIRDAAALLPNCPTPEIPRSYEEEMVQDEEQSGEADIAEG